MSRTVYSAQCTEYIAQCIVHCEQCIVYSAQCSVYSALYTVHYAMYTMHGIYWNGRVRARLNIFRISQYWDILNYTVCNISSEVCMIAVKHIYNCFISTNISCLLAKTESKPYIKTSPCSLIMYMTVTDSVLIVQLELESSMNVLWTKHGYSDSHAAGCITMTLKYCCDRLVLHLK